tara:strand:+ start:166 stop:561 length:396 start_codon:yes stop_codon:yes gene_type:complete
MQEFSIFLGKFYNSKILDAAKDIGINYGIFNSIKIAEFYSNHEWSVIQNSQVGKVINAVPDISKTDSIPWEEWFLMDGIIHHHILFTKKHPKSNMTWVGDLDDKEHPKQVLGILWHVHNEKDLNPYLIGVN